MENYYKLFDVPRNAEISEIRKAFRKQAKSCHPDLYQQSSEQVRHQQQLKFVRLSQAYETLADPQKRKKYDAKLSQAEAKANFKDHQKTRTSSSSSSGRRQTFNQSKTRPFDDTAKTEAKDDLNGLLREVEDLLGQYGGGFRDPLEMLVDWAKVIFQEMLDAWNESETESEKNQTQQEKQQEHSQSTKQERSQSTKQERPQSAKQETRKHPDPLDEVEAELQRLKRNHEQMKKSGNYTGPKTRKSEIEQELQNLKKKYRL